MKTKLRILYVEDSVFDAELLQIACEKQQTDIEPVLQIAEDATEAIQLFDQHPFDAILLDWNLLEDDTLTIADYIRAKNATIPIIFISGIWTEQQREKANIYKPKTCLTKENSEVQMKHIIELIQEPDVEP